MPISHVSAVMPCLTCYCGMSVSPVMVMCLSYLSLGYVHHTCYRGMSVSPAVVLRLTSPVIMVCLSCLHCYMLYGAILSHLSPWLTVVPETMECQGPNCPSLPSARAAMLRLSALAFLPTVLLLFRCVMLSQWSRWLKWRVVGRQMNRSLCEVF